MSDNDTLYKSAAAGVGIPIASDDIGGNRFQRVKITVGADGVNDGDVSATNPLPVSDAAGSLTVDAPVGTPVNVQIGDGTRTATVRDTGASDSLNVAIVDAAGAHITSFGGGTQFAEDAIHNSGDVGTLALVVRKDAGGPFGADGDYSPLQVDANGALVVTGGGGGTEYTEDAVAVANPVGGAQILVRQDTPAGLVTTDGDNVARRGTNFGAAYSQILTSAGAFVDSFGGGTQYTEDAASAADPVGNQLIARRRDALSSETTADGDVTALNSTAKGELYVKHVDALPVTDNAGSLTVDGTVTANQGGTWTVQPGNTANTTPWLATINQGGNSATVTAGGSVNVQSRGAESHDAPASANPNLVAGYASATAPADVADADVARAWYLRNGAQVGAQADSINRTASGALGTANAAVTVSGQGSGLVHWEIDTGTLVGTVVFEATLDDTNWFAINAVRINGTIIASTTSFADRGALDTAGYSQVRLRVSAYTSGTSNARVEGSFGGGLTRLSQALPTGNNNIGDVDVLTVPAPLSTTGGGTEATALRVTLANDSTGLVSVDDNGSSLTVDGSVSITGAVDTELPAAAALADATANPTVPAVGTFGHLWDGTDWERQEGDTAGRTVVVGAVADGAAVAGNPVLIAGQDGTNAQSISTNASGHVNIADGGNVITVDGSVSITGAVDTELPAAETPADNLTNATAAPRVNSLSYVFDGTAWDRLPGTTADGALVNLGANNDVTVAGTVTVDSELPAAETPADNLTNATAAPRVNGLSYVFDGTAWDRLPGTTVDGALVNLGANNDVTVTSGTVTANQGTAGTAWEVVGDVAHDAAAPANPVVVGAQMETMADSAPGTRSGTDGDATKLATADGAAFVIPTGPQIFTLHATGVQTGAQVHAAPGAGLSCYITAITFSIGAATASSVKVLNNAGADIWGPHYLEAVNGRGMHVTFPTPLKATANTRLDVTTTGSATQTVDIQGFIAPG